MLSNPIQSFGVSQATIEDRTTKDKAPLVILGEITSEFSQELIDNYGGSNPFPWASAPGVADASLSMTVKQYDVQVLKYLAPYIASALTENTSGDVSGFAGNLANVIGASAFNATTGIASVAPTASQSPVFGDYLIKVVSATTVDVYLDNQLDGLDYVNDALKINSTPITIPGTSGTVAIPGTNLTLTGGSGAIAMTIGDIARFNARPINAYNYEFLIGKTGASFREFSLTIFAEKIGQGYRALHLPRVIANGTPINFPEKEWSTFEATLKILYDSTVGYAAKWIVVGRGNQ